MSAGPTTVYLLIWIRKSAEYKPHILMHENVLGFPMRLLEETLSELYEFHEMILLPDKAGFPIERRRKYILGLLRLKMKQLICSNTKLLYFPKLWCLFFFLHYKFKIETDHILFKHWGYTLMWMFSWVGSRDSWMTSKSLRTHAMWFKVLPNPRTTFQHQWKNVWVLVSQSHWSEIIEMEICDFYLFVICSCTQVLSISGHCFHQGNTLICRSSLVSVHDMAKKSYQHWPSLAAICGQNTRKGSSDPSTAIKCMMWKHVMWCTCYFKAGKTLFSQEEQSFCWHMDYHLPIGQRRKWAHPNGITRALTIGAWQHWRAIPCTQCQILD